jgi:hypothetical protein
MKKYVVRDYKEEKKRELDNDGKNDKVRLKKSEKMKYRRK